MPLVKLPDGSIEECPVPTKEDKDLEKVRLLGEAEVHRNSAQGYRDNAVLEDKIASDFEAQANAL
jgi:hypothetical protein